MKLYELLRYVEAPTSFESQRNPKAEMLTGTKQSVDKHDSRFWDIISFWFMMGQHAVWRLTFSIGIQSKGDLINETNWTCFWLLPVGSDLPWPSSSGLASLIPRRGWLSTWSQVDVWCGRSKDLLRISTKLGSKPELTQFQGKIDGQGKLQWTYYL